MSLPIFPVSTVGSWPRPAWLRKAARRGSADLAELQDRATLQAIKEQEDAGVDIVSDGEQRRDNFCSFVAERLGGMQLMSMADLLDHVADKVAFEALLSALDVPAFAIKNPTVTGKLRYERPLVVEDARFLRAHTGRAIKVALPGPYLLSRSTWVEGLSREAYPTRRSLADDVVEILREEVQALADLGVEVVQLDEPVLTEVVFTGKAATRTFMCGALAATAEPEEELELAVELINRVVAGLRGGTQIALHVCRGNWSTREDVLLAGPYDALIPYFARMQVDQFVLEYATPRAGSLETLTGLPPGASLGLGVVDPRKEELESVDWILGRARRAAELLGPERVALNPDCGFATFAERPVATLESARRKLGALAEAARTLR